MCAASALALATFTLGAVQGAFTAWCIVTAFFYGGNFALYPTATVALFGREQFGANGFVSSGSSLRGADLARGSAALRQIGYLGMTLICGAFSFAGLLLSLFTRRAARAPSAAPPRRCCVHLGSFAGGRARNAIMSALGV